MNDSELHTLFASMRSAQPKTPLHQARLKALLLSQHREQTTIRYSLHAFLLTITKGRIVKKLSLTTPIVVVGTVLLAGTASAAAFYWFKTGISDSTSGNIVSISAKDCPSIPDSIAKATGAQLPAVYSFTAKYKIVNAAQISQSQIKDAAAAMCEERAVAANINQKFPDMQEFSASQSTPNSKGLYFPVYQSGIVTAVSGKQVTITDLQSSDPQYPKTATFALADDALATKAGTIIDQVKVGESVYFAYQNRAVAGESVGDSRMTNPGDLSVIRGIGVMTTNTEAIQQLRSAVQSGAVEELQSDPQRG